jgi:hypothetical protein
MMIRRSKAGYSNEEWLARRIPAAIAAMLLTGIALAIQPGDDGEARKPDPSTASSAAAPVAPDGHVLELLREHRRAVYDGRAPYSLLRFAQ